MIDFIVKYWIEFLFGLIISGMGVMAKLMYNQHLKNKAIDKGVEALLRNGKVWELSVSPQEARQWQTKTTVANLRHEGKEIILRIISDNMPGERAVPCEATLEDLYLFYFPTEEGGK